MGTAPGQFRKSTLMKSHYLVETTNELDIRYLNDDKSMICQSEGFVCAVLNPSQTLFRLASWDCWRQTII